MTQINEVNTGGMPSDKELLDFAGEEQFFLFCDADEFLDIAKSVLQRFGRFHPEDASQTQTGEPK